MSAAAPRGGGWAARRTWWTRERVLAALVRFHREFGLAPLSSERYHHLQTPTGTGNYAPARPYPSASAVLRHFPSFRAAWSSAGILVDRSSEPWTELEEWYLSEGAGILSRKELASDLRRTEGAVNRRLRDLGINSYRNHGWTLHRVERAAQVPRHLLEKYLFQGLLPYFRGSKTIFVDPADLLCVEEIDWRNPPAELEADARRSLARRMIAILSGRDWREGRLYRSDRIAKTDRRYARTAVKSTPKPTHVGPGDRVRVVREVESRPGVAGREGVVHLVYWSQQRHRPGPGRRTSRDDGEPGWMARVEFAKMKRHGNDRPRVTYSLPADAIVRASDPRESVAACAARAKRDRRAKRPAKALGEPLAAPPPAPNPLAARLDALLAEIEALRARVAELEDAARLLDQVRAILHLPTKVGQRFRPGALRAGSDE